MLRIYLVVVNKSRFLVVFFGLTLYYTENRQDTFRVFLWTYLEWYDGKRRPCFFWVLLEGGGGFFAHTLLDTVDRQSPCFGNLFVHTPYDTAGRRCTCFGVYSYMLCMIRRTGGARALGFICICSVWYGGQAVHVLWRVYLYMLCMIRRTDKTCFGCFFEHTLYDTADRRCACFGSPLLAVRRSCFIRKHLSPSLGSVRHCVILKHTTLGWNKALRDASERHVRTAPQEYLQPIFYGSFALRETDSGTDTDSQIPVLYRNVE